MATDAVVVGGGPGGLRAAVALAKAGRNVTLLQEGPDPGGCAHPDVPIGRGVTYAPGPLAETVHGAFRPVDVLDRGILLDGHVRRLPLSRPEIARLVPPTRLPSAALAWGRTRGTIELRKVIGGGAELRTYRDWVVQRFGEPVYERLYAHYCEARFGVPTEVSCNVARVVHGLVRDEPLFAPTHGPALAAVGVDVRTNVAVRGLTTGQVETDDGLFTGDVYVDVPPRRVVEWLGAAASAELRNDVSLLEARTLVQVLVRGPQDLPFETHVLGGAPFFRIVRCGLLPGCGGLTEHLCVQYALPVGDGLLHLSDDELAHRTVEALEAIGVRGASAVGARVQVLRDHHPTWVGPHLVRMRRYLLAVDELDILPVGRAGLHAPLDVATEFAWLAGILEAERPSLRALFRDLAEPPVLDPVDRAHLTRFVER